MPQTICTIALAALIAGALDILSAFVWSALAGGDLARHSANGRQRPVR